MKRLDAARNPNVRILANVWSAAMIVAICAASSFTVQAQAPAQISVQGYLEDGGNPVNTPQTFELTIYTAASGGTQLFLETHAGVTVSDGVYTILLGSIGDLTAVDFNQDLWVQTKVGSTVLAPRTKLLGSPAAMTLVVPASISGDAPDSRVVTVTNTATTGTYGHGLLSFSADHGASAGLYGVSASVEGNGVVGLATSSTGVTYGVYGESVSTDLSSAGVYGTGTNGVYGIGALNGVRGFNTTGPGSGVLGTSDSGNGVLGVSNWTAGPGTGVWGTSNSPTGVGVRGSGDATTGTAYGVYGESESTDASAAGVYGTSASTGVRGESTDALSGVGVKGEGWVGVRGESHETNGAGLYGLAHTTTGQNWGVIGTSLSSQGYGGYFQAFGTGLVAKGGAGAAADVVLAATSEGEDNGNLYSDPDYASSDLVLYTNDDIAIHLDENDDESGSTFTVNNSANTIVFSVNESGTVQVNGTTVHSSDRNRKEDLADVDVQRVLAGVAGLPMQTWRYRDDPVKHIGPMAQDFAAAFGVGQDDVTIASIDADGVALAAIQALYELVETQRSRLEQQHVEIAQLRAQVQLLIDDN